ncbi:MAG: hypothetical protein GWN58_29735, partial [Anaerolineae bacterium]|nr:hypothetical protein [Anaerolineae bacterium]
HDPLDYFRQTHPDMFKEITTMDLPGNRDMMGALAFSQNEATSQFLIAQMKDQLEHRDNLLNAGVSNWLVGGFSGLLLDGIATLGVGTVLNVAKAPFMVSRVARIAQLERLAAEGTAVAEAQAIELHKAASVGMFYGGADVGLQDVVDYDIGVQDYLIGIGAGALLGTGAGALINRWNK